MENQNDIQKRIIGLTGQSGAGKSTVGKLFAAEGALVIDCDILARQVVEPGKPALLEIRETFGAGVLDDEGFLNRPALAAIVFSDPNALHKLNRITHKYIREEVETRIAKAHADLVVIDGATLFESGIDSICSHTVCVLAEKETRIRRIIARDSLSRQKAEERIHAQPEDGFYRRRCDFVIENNGDGAALPGAVSHIMQEVSG